MTTLFLIHGRGQHTPPGTPEDQVPGFVDAIRTRWLHALNAGLGEAGQPPVTEGTGVVFPFYGNAFRDAVAARQGHGPGPDLVRWSAGHPMPDEVRAVCEVKARMLDDALAGVLGEPIVRGVPAGVGRPWWELDEWLRIPWLRAALQYLARRSGVSAAVIEDHFTDVAYYLGCAEVRNVVLGIVENRLSEVPAGEPVVVHGHSLGSVVAYDLLARMTGDRFVQLLSSTGSPLGLPAVQKHLLGHGGVSPAPVPAPVPHRPGAWVNGFDVRDVVAILNPLAPYLEQAVEGQVKDVLVEAGQNPHSVIGYLEDPAVAGPIGFAIGAERRV